MKGPTLDSLLDTLRRNGLLEPKQLDDVARALRDRAAEPRALAQALLKRGWLTAFQADQLLRGRGDDLVLGSYVLLDRLGEGGMGTVYKARQRGLGRTVALKVVRPDRLTNTDAVRRFRREIRAASQLAHPNVVVAFDADQAGGSHFFAMEYVEGTDLSRLVKERGRLPVAQACEYVRQAATGLQHAHEQGLVHRDIKPANLMLTKAGQVKVMDLGLTRVLKKDAHTLDATLTQTGAVVGTPDYMPPEQARDSHTVDIRGDVYSLGCTLYHLLTGDVPYPGGTAMEKVFKHQLEEPTPVEQVRPDVPPALAAVLRRMMARAPEQRYPTPAAVAAALQPFCRAAGPDGEADSRTEELAGAAPDTHRNLGDRTRTEAPGRPARRRRGRPLAFAGAAVLLLAGAALVAVVLSGPAPTAVGPTGRGPTAAPAGGPATPPDRTAPPTGPVVIAVPPPGPRAPEATLGVQPWRSWGPVLAVACSPDGRWVATGGIDNAVRLWDAKTGQEHAQLRGPVKPIFRLAFAPDGRTLAGAGGDSVVYLWDPEARKPPARLTGHSGDIYALAFSPDGATLATAGADQTIRLWSLGRPGAEATLLLDTQPVYSLAFSPDGKALASGGHHARRKGVAVRVWDVAAKTSRVAYQSDATFHAEVGFTRAGWLVHTQSPRDGAARSQLHVYDVAQEKDLQTFTFKGPIQRIAVAPAGDVVAVAAEHELKLCDPAAGTVRALPGKAPAPTALAFARTARPWSAATATARCGPGTCPAACDRPTSAAAPTCWPTPPTARRWSRSAPASTATTADCGPSPSASRARRCEASSSALRACSSRATARPSRPAARPG